MNNSKWFPTETLDEVIFQLSFIFLEEGVDMFPGYYQEVFAEFLSESKKLESEKHKHNLQMLALSSIDEIEKLATDELHQNNWLTSDEQMEEVNQWLLVDAPKMFEEIKKEMEACKKFDEMCDAL